MTKGRRLKSQGEILRDDRAARREQVDAVKRRLQWEVNQKVQAVMNGLELERQLDAELAGVRTWSDAWWKVLEKLDRIRTWLIENHGIQILARLARRTSS